MLKIENITKKFDDKTILNSMNLQINTGSIFGLVGINGSGKSTLLRLISGVYEPDGGHILFDDEDTYNNPLIRRDILFVSDDPYFPSNATIKTMKVFYSSFYLIDEVEYDRYLKVFGLKDNVLISKFSKGMKRQTALLFALAIKPKLLLLDECFDGLDPLVRYRLKKALFELIQDDRITIVISSHNLKELEDVCDSFGILEDGQINTYGDLLESKENIYKYQIAFKEDYNQEDFKDFEIMHFAKTGKVITLVLKGNHDENHEALLKMKPILIDELPVNFEELFIYEMESRGKIYE